MAKRTGRRSGRGAHRDALKSVFHLRDDVVERALLTGEHAGLLDLYFGEEERRELAELARQASAKRVRGGPRVFILPGIMGSTLGLEAWPWNDTIWFDPIDIAAGNLTMLTMRPGGHSIHALGVILFTYLKLKLRLVFAGYDAEFYPYDWRLPLSTLGAGLARRLEKEKGKVHLVAHSMGGLVARSAVAAGARKVGRVVMLGTPNYGSFAPVQAFRGIYPVVRKVAALDLHHDAEELASQVFGTFPGLYHMLPAPKKFSQVDLYSLENWPQAGPRPAQNLLSRALQEQNQLPEQGEDWSLIAGVNQETVVGIRAEGGEFIYETSAEGDGTVPLAFAQLPGVKTYYVEESHGSLPNNRLAGQSVREILQTGICRTLPDHWAPSRRGVLRTTSDLSLRKTHLEKRKEGDLSHEEKRRLLEEFVSPEAHEHVVAGAPATPLDLGYSHRFEDIVVGRRRQHRLDVSLALGSLTEADARAYVLGVYQDVAPSGAARAVDDRLAGAITDFTARRMFSGRIGEIFIMPAGRHLVQTEQTLLVGLGSFDRFDSDAQGLVAEQAIRTLIRTRVEDFATVLPGGGSGMRASAIVQNLFSGFIRGLLDADRDHHFRAITICEIDRGRYDEIKQELYRLASTPLFKDIQLTLTEKELPPSFEPTAPARRLPRGRDPVYLLVAEESASKRPNELKASLLGAGEKATVITRTKQVDRAALDTLLARTEDLDVSVMKSYGAKIADLVLDKDIVAALEAMKDRHLVLVHDAAASVVPWETINIAKPGLISPALEQGMSRKYSTAATSLAKWLEDRREGPVLDILLVVNPTGDLPGAEAEGDRLKQLFGARQDVKIKELRRSQATKEAILQELQSGLYDVAHYAGHASFDASDPSRAGILCHGKKTLGSPDLVNMGALPSLLFFNACESGRMRKGKPAKPRKPLGKRIAESVGLAEAFLRGGVGNYIGTYWPVGDASAEAFAGTFYGEAMQGKPLGEALLAGRKAVEKTGSHDWANYMHYGSFDFTLKQRA